MKKYRTLISNVHYRQDLNRDHLLIIQEDFDLMIASLPVLYLLQNILKEDFE